MTYLKTHNHYEHEESMIMLFKKTYEEENFCLKNFNNKGNHKIFKPKLLNIPPNFYNCSVILIMMDDLYKNEINER